MLARTLRFWDLTSLIIGTVIGSGIFLVPSLILRDVNGSVHEALAVWFGGGLLTLLGALSYGELSSRETSAGGLYVYLRDGFGTLPAFLYGWSLFFLIGSGTIATLAVAFGTYMRVLLPMTPLAMKGASIAMIVCIGLINIRGARESADLQNLTTLIKVLGVLAIALGLLWFRNSSSNDLNIALTGAGDLGGLRGFGVAMVSVLWAYEGWQYCTFSAGEAIHPQRDFPRAFLVGSLALIFLYLLTNVAYFQALGAERMMRSNDVAAAAVRAVFGNRAAGLVTGAILVSIVGATNGMILTSTRVYYAMADGGLFFRTFAKTHPRFKTPVLAITASSAWACLLAVTGTFEQLLTYVVFAGWVFYGLGAASIFIYRKKSTQRAPYMVPGYPFTPILFILAAFGLVTNTIIARPERAMIGVLLIASGIPAFMVWRSRSRRNGAVPGARAFPHSASVEPRLSADRE
jgi:basic amino acid/polyamine antiporter, APA family